MRLGPPGKRRFPALSFLVSPLKALPIAGKDQNKSRMPFCAPVSKIHLLIQKKEGVLPCGAPSDEKVRHTVYPDVV